MDFPDSSAGKEPACNAGDPSLIPGLGRSTEERMQKGPDGSTSSTDGGDCVTNDYELHSGLGAMSDK